MYYPGIPSTGWSDLRRNERRKSTTYEVLAVAYTHTSRRVGDIRRQIIELATAEGIKPPITRHDIKPESRRREEIVALGIAALGLLTEHDLAVNLNLEAMHALREEDCALANSLRSNK